MRAAITKIQILTDKSLKLPISYCHRDDRDHEPELVLERSGEVLIVRAKQALYKVKINPQTKNRVDMYVSLAQARNFGAVLRQVAICDRPEEWRVSDAKPGAKATGTMRLPTIVWARTSQCIRTAARVRSGFEMIKADGYINVDLEYPDPSHIKMKHHEIHIGIPLGIPKGGHDPEETIPVHVPEEEFQRARNEANPIQKVRGDFYLELSIARAAGLGDLLHTVEAPTFQLDQSA